MEDTNLNINNSECIKERAVWGGTEYINICTQETSIVPWGVDIYIGCGTLIFFCLVVTIAIICEFKD